MFNMTKVRASNASGKSFYANHLSSNDYYSEHEKIQGYWLGELAEAFGLRGGIVTSEEFSLFQRNINPLTLGKLTQKTVSNGPRFFDFQCAAPKSVSVMSLFDDRLMNAHLEAVREAMAELERLAAARVRTGENVRTNNYETTGKLIYAEFTHDTSRSLDPQIHTHNVVCNVTLTDEGKYKALETLEICRAIRYAGKVYHNALAKKCQELGYETIEVRDRRGNVNWCDLKCVPDDVMKRFSKRREEIEKAEEEFIAKHGRKPTLSENNAISMATRSEKMKTSNREAVFELQMKQMSEAEKRALENACKRAKSHGSVSAVNDRNKTVELVRNVIDELYERESVLKQDKILAEVLNRSLGKVDLKTLKEVVKDIPELRNLGGDTANPYYSPEVVIERELQAINSVDQQRGIFEAIAPDFTAFPGKEERAKQAELIHGLLCSKDRFNLFRGVAGAGKTSTLQEFCNGLRSGGVESIYLVAPTNSATDVLKQEGFEQSQTVASFLLSPQKPPQGSYVIIDESGLNSLREGVEILKLARANDYRVLFVGDARQHTAVESGDFFRLLEDYSRIQKFSLTDIHRQQHEEYRRGIFECVMGQYEQAFERFDNQHFIHEGKQDYLQDAAAQYMAYTEQGQFLNRAILVTPTHEECDKLTDAVREKLKKNCRIASKGREVEVFRSLNKPKAWLRNAENYQEGMTIGFIRNMNGVASAGETATIKGIENGELFLSNGKRIFAKNASDFIDVGETRKIELCPGDLIQFRVNLKAQKIYNGTLARVCNDPGKIELLSADGQPYKMIDMPKNYGAYDYGWVTTSHKSQGRTAENVVVAAESMDRKAFYVALSRGRKEMSLHCPDKEYLKRALAYRTGERTTIHDLIRDREIPPHAILPLSDEAREQKAKTLPDNSYKDLRTRMRSALRKAKAMLSDTAMIRRMRKHRERLFDEYYRVESEGFAVALVSKVVDKISGLFKKPEPPKEELPDIKTETLAQERENARQAEKNSMWNVFKWTYADYVEKRKAYHEQYGGGEPFKLTKREIDFKLQQDTRQRQNKYPQKLPDWLVNWEETARHEAEKSRAALTERLAERQAAEKRRREAWKNFKQTWSGRIANREDYHKKLGLNGKFRLWDSEVKFMNQQKIREENGEMPLPIPGTLTNWKSVMEKQLRKEQAPRWNAAKKKLNQLFAARKAYYAAHGVADGYVLWDEEKKFADRQESMELMGYEPEPIPESLRNWKKRAIPEVQKLQAEKVRIFNAAWKQFDKHLQNYADSRTEYQNEIEPGKGPYRFTEEQLRDIAKLQEDRKNGLMPEYPSWLRVDWKRKLMQIQQKKYEEKALHDWNWKDFDEKWSACKPGGGELRSNEIAFLKIVERLRNAGSNPPEWSALPAWMKNEEVRDVQLRNLKIMEIRKELGLRPGDEYNPVDPERSKVYQRKKAELADRIEEYDKKAALENLSRWMQEKHPSKVLKQKILNGLYLKHGYDPNLPKSQKTSFTEYYRHCALREYEKYEENLRYGGIVPKVTAPPKPEPVVKPVVPQKEDFVPASQSMIKILYDLQAQGKVDYIPENLSKEMASKMISDAIAEDPLQEHQIQILQKKIDRYEIPYMSPEKLASLKQKDFTEIMMKLIRRPEYLSRTSAESKEKEKSRGMDI